jgi:chromosome segregation ATPase
MRKKRSPQSARLELDGLPDDEKALYEDIKAYCAECRLSNTEISRVSVRVKFACGTDLICQLMGIMETLEGADSTANHPGAETPVPPEVAAISAEQRAGADKFERTMAHSFRNALETQQVSIRSEYQSEIDGSKAAIRALSKRLADFEAATEELSGELRELKSTKAGDAAILEQTRVELDEANEHNKRLTAAIAAADESSNHLNREVADLRQLNSIITEIKQERDMYRLNCEELTKTEGELKIRLAVLAKGEAHLLSMMVENSLDIEKLRKDHATELAANRHQHEHEINKANRWIADLQQQLVKIANRVVA